jgi:hypothetical protein
MSEQRNSKEFQIQMQEEWRAWCKMSNGRDEEAMSEQRKPREFWVVDMSQGDELSFKAFKYPVNGNKIHCREVMPAEISREAMFEAAAECWKQSQSWEQGMEGPAATDRGSLKHGFLEGVRWTMERLK